MLSQIARASLRSELLIDFNCFIDTEVGLIRLIVDKYFDERVFNKELLTTSFISIFKTLINRKDMNPLYSFANEDISREDLDEYYKEFMETEYDSILIRSVTTEMKSLLNLFKSEPGIHVTFLCHNQKEKNVLTKDLELQGDRFVLASDNIDFSKFTSYYFKYISDDIDKYIFPYKTYYFSKHLVNFNDQFDLNNQDIVNKILFNHGEIEILDLYNKSYFGGVQTDGEI